MGLAQTLDGSLRAQATSQEARTNVAGPKTQSLPVGDTTNLVFHLVLNTRKPCPDIRQCASCCLVLVTAEGCGAQSVPPLRQTLE